MFVLSSKTVFHPLNPAIGSNVSLAKSPTVSIPPVAKRLLSLQVRSKKEKFQVQGNLNCIRRREIMHFTAASLSAIALFLAEPSEARVRKPEVRRKIMEKLELERKKASIKKQASTPAKGDRPFSSNIP